MTGINKIYIDNRNRQSSNKTFQSPETKYTMNIQHISYTHHIEWQRYLDTKDETNPESQQKRWKFWENLQSTCSLTTKEITVFWKNLKHDQFWCKSPATRINGYSMLAEWRDPDLCRLVWNTNQQEKGKKGSSGLLYWDWNGTWRQSPWKNHHNHHHHLLYISTFSISFIFLLYLWSS